MGAGGLAFIHRKGAENHVTSTGCCSEARRQCEKRHGEDTANAHLKQKQHPAEAQNAHPRNNHWRATCASDHCTAKARTWFTGSGTGKLVRMIPPSLHDILECEHGLQHWNRTLQPPSCTGHTVAEKQHAKNHAVIPTLNRVSQAQVSATTESPWSQ